MLDAFAAGFLVFAYVATALFQIAIVLGAPLGEYSYGGQNPGILKLPFRIASVFSALVMFAIAGHYLAQLGVFTPLLDQAGNSIANWGFAVFAGLSAIANNITRSQKEKRLWGGTTIAMLLAAVIVAV
jgi:predicted cobalt transporter CbtA